MKRRLIFGVFVFCIVLFLISFVPAPNNNNNNNNNTSQIYCDENSDCVFAVNKSSCCTYSCRIILNKDTVEANDDLVIYESGTNYYTLFNQSQNCTCESGCASVVTYPKCVANSCTSVMTPPNDDENETKIDDDDSDNNETEDEEKVCCMITKTEDDNQIEIEYSLKETKDCLKNETDKKREIVNNSFCKEKRFEIKEKNRLKFEGRTGIDCPEECTCTGVVMKCQLASGREMTIFAGKSGNVIFQIKGINMTTNVTLYKENDTIYGNFSNKTKEIKILPDKVREKIMERLESKLEEEKMNLDEDGFYNFEAKKKSKLFWIFPVKEKIEVEMDSETGVITRTKTRWWGFLARDKKD